MLEKQLIKALDWNRSSKDHLVRAMDEIENPSEEIKNLFKSAIKETEEAYETIVDILHKL